MITFAKQGHRYKIGFKEVLAMDSGTNVRVRDIVQSDIGITELGQAREIPAWILDPMPMRYFHGQVPE